MTLAATGASTVAMIDNIARPRAWSDLLHLVRGYGWFDLVWSLGLLLAAYAAGRAGSWLVLRSLQRWAKHSQSTAEDALAKHLPDPLRVALPALAVYFVLPLLGLSVSAVASLAQGVLVVVIVAVGWIAYRGVLIIQDIVEHQYDISAPDNLQARTIYTQLHGFRNIAGFVILIVTLGFALMTFSTVRQIGTGLLASAGVAGIVLGFAAQRTLSTLLAGIQIAITQPIRVDDVVIVEGEWGRIEEITLTYVVMKIWDERRLIVPVGQFLEKPFQNWTRVSSELLGAVELHVDYGVPLPEIRTEFERVLAGSKLWDHRVASVQVTDTTERTMLVRLLTSGKNSSDVWDLRCEVREKLIAFVRHRYPDALPRLRAEVTGPVEPHAPG